MALLQVSSRIPQRISATGTSALTTAVGDYVVSRLDGGYTTVTVSSAWFTDGVGLAVELGLSQPLVADLIYVLTWQVTSSVTLSYRAGVTAGQSPLVTDEDPEAEAFGTDNDWLADGLTGAGDLPTIRGRQAFQKDLAAIALTNPGELVHRPSAGAGLKLNVNGPATPDVINPMLSRLKQAWAADSRVRQNGVSVPYSISSLGVITVNGRVIPIALDDEIAVSIPGGST